MDNGSQTSHEPFQADYRNAFNGKALVILQAQHIPGPATFTATAEGLAPTSVDIELY